MGGDTSYQGAHQTKRRHTTADRTLLAAKLLSTYTPSPPDPIPTFFDILFVAKQQNETRQPESRQNHLLVESRRRCAQAAPIVQTRHSHPNQPLRRRIPSAAKGTELERYLRRSKTPFNIYMTPTAFQSLARELSPHRLPRLHQVAFRGRGSVLDTATSRRSTPPRRPTPTRRPALTPPHAKGALCVDARKRGAPHLQFAMQ